MKAKELQKILKEDGWYLDRTKGSHQQYKHPEKKGTVTVPLHKSDLPIKTAKSILKQAGLL